MSAPTPASGVPSVEAPTEAVSNALYAHNSPVIELPDDEYDCCADVAIAAVLTSDWFALVLAEARAEAWDEGLRFGQLHWATNYAGVYQNGSPLRQAPNPYRRPDESEDA